MLINGSYGELTEDSKNAIEKILQSGKLMVLSIEDFLNVRRIEQGRIIYERKPLDYIELTRAATDELQFLADQKHLEYNVSLPDRHAMINVDRGKTKQILTNLIENSIKYTKEGHVNVSVEVDEDKGKTRVIIEDTGIGVSKKAQITLFEKFTRAKNANEANTQGTGLGLFVAKQFVEAQGGTIELFSEGEGKGAKFTVEFPLIAKEEEQAKHDDGSEDDE